MLRICAKKVDTKFDKFCCRQWYVDYGDAVRMLGKAVFKEGYDQGYEQDWDESKDFDTPCADLLNYVGRFAVTRGRSR